jgi:hypothetical protein
VDADHARLLDDEEAHRAVAGVRQGHRIGKPGGDLLQNERRLRLGGAAAPCQRRQQQRGRNKPPATP